MRNARSWFEALTIAGCFVLQCDGVVVGLEALSQQVSLLSHGKQEHDAIPEYIAAQLQGGRRNNSTLRQLIESGDTDAASQFSLSTFFGGMVVGMVLTVIVIGAGLMARNGNNTCLQCRVEKTMNDDETGEALLPSATSGKEGDSISSEAPECFWPRCFWLVVMLMVQSLSSFILSGFQDLIASHPTLIYFLTMLVGLGGNVGGQSVVLAVRRLALGHPIYIRKQALIGLALSGVLVPIAFVRAMIQQTSLPICITIGASAGVITTSAALLGTALPVVFASMGTDPAHCAPLIQVIMDMFGIFTVCIFGNIIVIHLFHVT